MKTATYNTAAIAMFIVTPAEMITIRFHVGATL